MRQTFHAVSKTLRFAKPVLGHVLRHVLKHDPKHVPAVAKALGPAKFVWGGLKKKKNI